MKITALAPWFGSKRNLASDIHNVIGKHSSYWEPFCGSMAVLLAKPKCRLETVNDLHADLINLARVVQNHGAGKDLLGRVRTMLCSDEVLAESHKLLASQPANRDLDVYRAAAYLAASWMGRSGEAGLASKASPKLCVRWGNGGGAPGTRWSSVVRSIGYWRRRLESVTILRRDGFEVLEKIKDEAGCAIYCDPPYIIKSDVYEHEFAAPDHQRLAYILGRFKKARVVVSYYDHPTVRQLYTGWSFVDCSRVKSLGNQGERPKGKSSIAPELLIVNDPTAAQVDLF